MKSGIGIYEISNLQLRVFALKIN